AWPVPAGLSRTAFCRSGRPHHQAARLRTLAGRASRTLAPGTGDLMGEQSGTRPRGTHDHRLRRKRQQGLMPVDPAEGAATPNAIVDCGWGRLIFAHTVERAEEVAAALSSEGPDRRDIAIYARDPHVVLSHAPQELFLDPSHTYRLELSTYRPARRQRRA